MKLKFLLILALILSLSTPLASSQAANALNFSASESFILSFPEEDHFVNGRRVPFVKGDQMSSAELRKETEHICGEDYSSPALSVKGASGDLSNHKLLHATSVLSAKWTVASNGKNTYLISAACKQWGNFPIPNSDGYQFNLKLKSINPYQEKLPSSPWYSKRYLSQNQWKVNYSNNAREWGDVNLFRSRWLPRTELPPMPMIRVQSIYYGVNDVDHLLPMASLTITGGQFTSTATGGWNKWTLEINNGISTIFRLYTSNPSFDWPRQVRQDEFLTRTFEIRVMQAGYRYSSQVGRFVIPPVGENVQLTEVHRTPEGALVGDFCNMEC